MAINSNTLDHMAYKDHKSSTIENAINESTEQIKNIQNDFIWSLKYSFGTTFNQTSSSVSSSQTSSKKTEDLSLEYQFNYNQYFDVAFGIRYDNELYTLTSPNLDITSNRLLATASIIYYFPHTKIFKDNLYIAGLIGFGTSKSTIDGLKTSGTANILPGGKIGYNFKTGKDYYFFSELGIESLFASEKFENGIKQETSQVNTKLSVGIKF